MEGVIHTDTVLSFRNGSFNNVKIQLLHKIQWAHSFKQLYPFVFLGHHKRSIILLANRAHTRKTVTILTITLTVEREKAETRMSLPE